jgi:2-desacetyl-2-hydroxyethyl bacteriochlorophyllide A dehydrogenase
MKISVIESPGKIVIKDATVPLIGDDDVLVKLEGTGVCASNLPVWEGREWFTYPFEPGAPGHEGYGIVAASGSRAGNLSPGDSVALISYNAYAEYDKAPASNVVKLPRSLAGTPFPGEPAACAVNVFNRSEIRKGQTVLIIGAGYLGCLLIQLIKNAGAHTVVVSRRKTSLDFAKTAGADQLVQLTDYYKTIQQLKALFPEGIERIIEATGSQSSIDIATELIAVGGKLIIAGYHQDGLRNVNMQVWNWKGIDVINAHERDPQKYIDGMMEAIKLAEDEVMQPEKFITHYINFSNINEAFVLLKKRPEAFLKALIIY